VIRVCMVGSAKREHGVGDVRKIKFIQAAGSGFQGSRHHRQSCDAQQNIDELLYKLSERRKQNGKDKGCKKEFHRAGKSR
jgi:hypothetical protein